MYIQYFGTNLYIINYIPFLFFIATAQLYNAEKYARAKMNSFLSKNYINLYLLIDRECKLMQLFFDCS